MKLVREPLLYHSSPLVKFLSFLLIILLSLILTLILGLALGIAFFGTDMMDAVMDGLASTDPAVLPMLKYLQIVNTIGMFVLPPLIFAWLVSKRPAEYLSMDKRPGMLSSIAGVAAILFILPFIHWTAGITEMMLLPEWLSGLEDWMKRSEEQAKELTDLFLGTTSIAGLNVNLIMIALLPAIGEEFLFRGVLLRMFKDWSRNVHVAVIVSAFLFSALHMQFYGFLPRFILGILLGYLFVWSRSIWVPVIVHFFNNAIAVYAAWLFERGSITTDAESFGDVDQPLLIILSFVSVLILTVAIRYFEAQKKGNTIE